MAEMGEDAADTLSSTEAAGPRAGLGELAQLFERLDAVGAADRTLGAPRAVGERSVLPLAEVWYGHGFGLGGGERPAEEAGAASPRAGYGGGGGGGGRVRPVAVVEVGPDGARVHPVLDLAAIGLALAPAAAAPIGPTKEPAWPTTPTRWWPARPTCRPARSSGWPTAARR